MVWITAVLAGLLMEVFATLLWSLVNGVGDLNLVSRLFIILSIKRDSPNHTLGMTLTASEVFTDMFEFQFLLNVYKTGSNWGPEMPKGV